MNHHPFPRAILLAALTTLAAATLPACGTEAPDTETPAAQDAGADAGADAPRVDPRVDVPRVDARPGDAGADGAAVVDVGADAGAEAGGAQPEDALVSGDALPLVDGPPAGRACRTGADCPAFPGWTCGGATPVCRCTPAGGEDQCGRRDRDCDGVADPEALCGARCTNTATDPRNCGGCGRACAAGEACAAGACVCEAPGSERRVMCGACVDTSTRGPTSPFCAFCLTVCSPVARRTSQALNDCCVRACDITTTPPPCRA